MKEEDGPQQGASSSGTALQRAGNTSRPMSTEEQPTVENQQLTKLTEISKITVHGACTFKQLRNLWKEWI
jgi:hypothetical protein